MADVIRIAVWAVTFRIVSIPCVVNSTGQVSSVPYLFDSQFDGIRKCSMNTLEMVHFIVDGTNRVVYFIPFRKSTNVSKSDISKWSAWSVLVSSIICFSIGSSYLQSESKMIGIQKIWSFENSLHFILKKLHSLIYNWVNINRPMWCT